MSEKSGGLWQKYKKLPRWKRYLLISISLFVIYSATGFLAVPLLIEKIAPGKLTEALSREVTIENVYINPYLLSVEVDEFEVRNREGDDTFVGFHSLFLDFQISSLFRFAPIVRARQLSGFVVQFSREDSETYNFSDLLSSQENEKEQEKKGPPRFSINNIEISDSAIYFDDQPYGTLHEVEEISISVPFLSNLPSLIEIDVEPSFLMRSMKSICGWGIKLRHLKKKRILSVWSKKFLLGSRRNCSESFWKLMMTNLQLLPRRGPHQ